MASRLSMLSHCAIESSNALYAINVYLSSLESKTKLFKSILNETVTSYRKKIELVYKMNQ